MFLAFDPGKTTGWALFDSTGSLMEMGQASLEQLMSLCDAWEKLPITVVIYEDWVLFKHKARQQAGSRMESSQAIGIIKNLGRKLGAKIVVQGSDIKSTAEKLTQVRPPSNHAQSHQIDAFNHGAFYLITVAKIRKTALEEEMENGK